MAAVTQVAKVVSTSNNTTYALSSFTPSANSLFVIIAFVRGNTAAPTIVNTSGTAITWTNKASGLFNTSADGTHIFWGRTGGSAAASVYTVTPSGNSSGCIAYCFQITGADQTTSDPLKQAVVNQASSTNPTSGTIPAIITSNAVLSAWAGALSSSTTPAVSTPPTNWTELSEDGFATPTTNASSASRNSGETGTSITFTAATTPWGLAFVEVYNTGAGPTTIYSNLESMFRGMNRGMGPT
jgi:hypothetical protein